VEADAEDTGEVPKITNLPEGIEVIEQRVGRAVGKWVLQVRCQCGRRWFELEPVDATHCPRCGMYVYIDMPASDATRP
jgi:rRNA maturation endonuclease Nob1